MLAKKSFEDVSLTPPHCWLTSSLGQSHTDSKHILRVQGPLINCDNPVFCLSFPDYNTCIWDGWHGGSPETSFRKLASILSSPLPMEVKC